MARWTYQLKFIRCGKQNCRCMKGGLGHGPYWYAAHKTADGLKWKYIGKVQPDTFDPADDAPEPTQQEARWQYEGRMNAGIAMRIFGFIAWPSSLDGLKKRWRILVREHHPDAGGDTAICAAINAAYTWARRSQYP